MIAHLLFYMAETFEYDDLPLYRYRKEIKRRFLVR